VVLMVCARAEAHHAPMGAQGQVERWGILLLGAGLLCALVALALHPSWTVDDAYITLRYARNLAEHGQLTWNVGEPGVEGYTGVFLPVALAAAMRLGLPALVVARGLGIVSLLVSGPLVYATLRTLGVRAWLAGLGALGLLCAPMLHLHALGGLETVLFVAAVSLSLALFARALRPEGRFRDAPLCLALLLAALVRPEGVVLAAAALAALGAMRARTGTRTGVEFALLVGGLVVIPGLAYMAWRYGAYGQWLPNSFHAKALGGGLDSDSARALGLFLARYGALATLAVLAAQLTAARSSIQRLGGGPWGPDAARGSILAGVGVLFLAALALVYLGCHLAMNVGHRFFAPFLPVLAVLACLGCESGLRSVADDGARAARRTVAVLAVLLSLAQGLVFALEARDHRSFAADYDRLIREVHVPAGERVAELCDPGEWLVVVADAGAIPYVADRPTIDLGMINDPHLARGNPTPDEILEYFFERDARCAVFTSTRWDELAPPDARAGTIVADPRFARYALVERFRTSTPRFEKYFEFVLVQPRAETAGHNLP
jgi:arabinofuranosyltransferase